MTRGFSIIACSHGCVMGTCRVTCCRPTAKNRSSRLPSAREVLVVRREALTVFLCLLLGMVALSCGSDDSSNRSGGAGGRTGGEGGTVGAGGDGGETGGTGGDGGLTGAGGGGANDALPEVTGFEPLAAGVGFHIRVLGKNFASSPSQNAVLFTSSSGVPRSIESKGIAVAQDRIWFEGCAPKREHGPDPRRRPDREGRDLARRP